jgi:hypothetical protein
MTTIEPAASHHRVGLVAHLIVRAPPASCKAIVAAVRTRDEDSPFASTVLLCSGENLAAFLGFFLGFSVRCLASACSDSAEVVGMSLQLLRNGLLPVARTATSLRCRGGVRPGTPSRKPTGVARRQRRRCGQPGFLVRPPEGGRRTSSPPPRGPGSHQRSARDAATPGRPRANDRWRPSWPGDPDQFSQTTAPAWPARMEPITTRASAPSRADDVTTRPIGGPGTTHARGTRGPVPPSGSPPTRQDLHREPAWVAVIVVAKRSDWWRLATKTGPVNDVPGNFLGGSDPNQPLPAWGAARILNDR